MPTGEPFLTLKCSTQPLVSMAKEMLGGHEEEMTLECNAALRRRSGWTITRSSTVLTERYKQQGDIDKLSLAALTKELLPDSTFLLRGHPRPQFGAVVSQASLLESSSKLGRDGCLHIFQGR